MTGRVNPIVPSGGPTATRPEFAESGRLFEPSVMETDRARALLAATLLQ